MAIAVSPKDKEYDHLFKIVIVGDSGCGKSSLLVRFTDGNYSDVYISTIGVDFKFRQLRLNGKNIKLQIWDTAGQERFRNITASFYRGAHGIVLVYDVANKNSFDNVHSWLEDIARNHGYGSSSSSMVSKPSIILVGNKCDMPKKVVSTDAAQRFAEKNGLQFIEASAKDSSNVETTFVNLVSEILQQAEAHGGSSVGVGSGSTLKLQDPAAPTTGGCCW